MKSYTPWKPCTWYDSAVSKSEAGSTSNFGVRCEPSTLKPVVDPDATTGAAPLRGLQARAAVVKTKADAAAGSMVSSEEFLAQRAELLANSAAARRDAMTVRRNVYGDPRTLYGRGGGVFGLARLVDRMMDAWMADPALNENQAVARWNESAQK